MNLFSLRLNCYHPPPTNDRVIHKSQYLSSIRKHLKGRFKNCWVSYARVNLSSWDPKHSSLLGTFPGI